METAIFILVDVIIFGLLIFGINMDWIVAFFASTAITYALWYLYYIIMGEK